VHFRETDALLIRNIYSIEKISALHLGANLIQYLQHLATLIVDLLGTYFTNFANFTNLYLTMTKGAIYLVVPGTV